MGDGSVILLDTHVMVWWVSEPSRLSKAAHEAIKNQLKTGPLWAATISILEISTASRRGRLDFARPFSDWLADLRTLPDIQFQPLTVEIARMAGAFGEEIPGDPADRIIAATAMHLEAHLVTADKMLLKVKALQTIW